MEDKETIFFKYYFIFDDGKRETFKILLDRKTLKLIPDTSRKPAPWTKLEHHQCSNCPLKKETSPECPLAINLSTAIPQFSDRQSFDRVHVMVETAERTYTKDTTLQSGLSAMMGIFMVTSDCPVMDILKPMVRFHLPFASVEETVYRAATTFLLRQYFKYKNGENSDWDLKGLLAGYEQIQMVNIGMAQRMRSVVDKDANLNALIVLDVFAKELPYSIETKLQELEYLFE